MQEPYLYVNSRLLRRKKRKQRKILLFCFLLVLITALIFIAFPKSKTTKSVAKAAVTPTPTSTLNVAVASQSNGLEDAVQSALEGSTGTYAVAIKNLKTNQTYYFNSHTPFDTASLYKLWIAGETYKQIEDGTLEEDQVISQDVAVLNKKFAIASDSAELKEGRVSRSISDALSRMITYSDNYSALVLTEKVKLSNVTEFLESNGFSESAIGTKGADPTTTASDISLLLERLYKGQLVNEANTQSWIDLLKKQQINGKIPSLLPEEVEVAHKTGELGSVSHDAAIVYTPDADYIIVVMSESNSKPGADARIAQISKNVYDYFIK